MDNIAVKALFSFMYALWQINEEMKATYRRMGMTY